MRSWNFFATDVNETVILDTAAALIETGLARLGFKYVNIGELPSPPPTPPPPERYP